MKTFTVAGISIIVGIFLALGVTRYLGGDPATAVRATSPPSPATETQSGLPSAHDERAGRGVTIRPEAASEPRPDAGVPVGWTVHRDRNFSVALPAGWTVREEQGRVAVKGPDGEVQIWPMFLKGADLNAEGAAAVVRQVARKVWPALIWGDGGAVSKTAVRFSARVERDPVACSLAWVSTPDGTAAYFYGTRAPASRYGSLTETFASILSSFRATGTPADPGRSARVSYRRFRDPVEGSFDVDYPEGWAVSGGLYRGSATDVRGWVLMTSRDRKITVQMGDPRLGTFHIPMAGFPEGSVYSPGYNFTMQVRGYQPAAQFLPDWIRWNFERSCPEARVDEVRDRSREVAAVQAGDVPGSQRTLADVTFSCRAEGRESRGHFLAQVVAFPGGMWLVEFVNGYLAAVGVEPEAHGVWRHVVGSFRADRAWEQRQQALAMTTSQQVAGGSQAVSDSIRERHDATQRILDGSSRRWSNAYRGVEEVVDTPSGRRLTVQGGSNYFWTDIRGNVAGTDTYGAPSADFRQLVKQ